MNQINIERLHVSTTDVKPRNIDWNPEANGEYVEPDHQWWQSFTFEDDGTDRTLIGTGGSTIAVVVDGVVYQDYASYADDARDSDAWDDDDEAAEFLTDVDFDGLLNVEPYQWGAEGPMMNYWYPIEEDSDRTFDPVAEAAALKDLPLCVVRVGDEYGLALTGGGMDFSWEICAAFITIEKLPPAHFADLPAMAMHWGEREQLVYEAMKRTLTVEKNRAEQRLSRLDDLRERMANR